MIWVKGWKETQILRLTEPSVQIIWIAHFARWQLYVGGKFTSVKRENRWTIYQIYTQAVGYGLNDHFDTIVSEAPFPIYEKLPGDDWKNLFMHGPTGDSWIDAMMTDELMEKFVAAVEKLPIANKSLMGIFESVAESVKPDLHKKLEYAPKKSSLQDVLDVHKYSYAGKGKPEESSK